METLAKPGSVIALGLVQIITGAVFLLGGTALLTIAFNGTTTLLAFGSVHIPIGTSFVVVGVASLRSSKRLVWTLGLAVGLVSVVDDLVGFAFVQLPYEGTIGTAVVLVTGLVTIYLLGRREARSFFAS